MTTLLVVTGPPGAGKSTVAGVLADRSRHSVLVEGDAFFRFLRTDAIEPWLPESHDQNNVVTHVAAQAAGAFVRHGYDTVYDGVVGPWFLDTFVTASGLDVIDYVVLLPSVDVCVQRVVERRGHGFTDEAATRKMHSEFEASSSISNRHVLHDPPDDPFAVADLIESARRSERLRRRSAWR